MLAVDRAARTIQGLAVPYDITGQPYCQLPRRFPFGSLTWGEFTPLLIDHDRSLQVGRAIEFRSARWGLWTVFRVRNGPMGDKALEMADVTHWAFSIGTADAECHIASDGVEEYVSARIVEVSLTNDPVFN